MKTLFVLSAVILAAYADHHAPAPYHPAPYHPAPAPYHPAPAPYHPKPAPYKEEAPKNYAYSYDVNEYDEYGNPNIHSKTEVRDGYKVEGQYKVQLPDCRTQIVDYYVDEYQQYHADVKYEGKICEDYTVKHKGPYKPAPYKPAPYKPAPAPYKPAPAPYKPAPAPYKPAPAPYKSAPAPYKPAPHYSF